MKYFYSSFLLLFSVSCLQRDSNKTEVIEQAPKVIAVYPTTDSLPENLLRLYVQFSESMKVVDNLENIKLVNDKGEEIEGAVFNNVYELWDNEQKLLTLILDPSRVKTGLRANQILGRALESGKHFKLIIEKAEDINGQPLAAPFVKNIYVLNEDKEIPDINNWSILAPSFGNTSALCIRFPQVLDRLSLLHRLRLMNADNDVVEGKVEVTNKEKEWRFIPKNKWKKGSYSLQVNSRLEDPTGNNLNGLFDHEIGGLKNREEGKILKLSIVVE